jgi:hypothetical protein
VKDRRVKGATMRVIANELGIAAETLRNWYRGRPPRRPATAVRAVSIAVTRPAATTSRSVVVHGPTGLRIEGLDVSGIAALLKVLS